jgi:hypothetical protein
MRDERQWKLGVVQFQALRDNIPGYIPEKLVHEFHAILDILSAASEEDFDSFRIPKEELKPRVVSVQMGGYRSPGRTNYSKDNYCDSNLFQRKIDSLTHYLPIVEQPFRTKATPETPNDYYSLDDAELEQLAIKYRIGGYGSSFGPSVDRDVIITKLQTRDRVNREANPIPHQSIKIGTMIESTIQQSSSGASATLNISTIDLQNLLEKIKEVTPQLGLNSSDENELKSDVATMELQIGSGRPKTVIIRESLISVRGILEKMAGTLAASGVLHLIDQYMKHHP